MPASRRSFASACCSALLAIAAIACSKPAEGTPGTSDASASTATIAPGVAPASPGDPYLTLAPVSATSVGHTSYVLKLSFGGGVFAAFKPRSKLPLGDHRYKGEIAAYRLASALHLHNVPRTVARSFSLAELRAVRTDIEEKALVDDDGRVRGALIPWIEGYRVLPLEDPKQRARWEPWLFDAHATIPDDDRALASSISTMMAFDYVTANWDRWSGGNVAEEGAGGRVLFVDNDGAFYDWPAPAALARQRAQLERVTRFSRGFVDALRALDADTVRAALGDEAPGVPLLSDRAAAGVDARRVQVLAIVDARIADAGARSALCFE